SGRWPTRCAAAWTPPSTSTCASACWSSSTSPTPSKTSTPRCWPRRPRAAPEADRTHLKAQARQTTIGQLVDDAMAGIERDNPALKGVLPKDYARPALDKQRLGQLIDLISNIKVGDEARRGQDVLGRVYEYFLSQFA